MFKVAGKIFAITALTRQPLQVSLKCDPLLAGQLRQAHAAVRPGYHLNKRHWNTVTIDGSVPDQMIEAGCRPDGAWNRKQLELLGIPWQTRAYSKWVPPAIARVVGRTIPAADYEQFLAIRGLGGRLPRQPRKLRVPA